MDGESCRHPWRDWLRGWSRTLIVVVFAAGMAWAEAAVVAYLRLLVDRLQPYQADPLPMIAALGNTEVAREFATLVMLLGVAWLAGGNLRLRLGYFLIAFGVWDLFYYVFLRMITGWPATPFDWDVLFLIPLPWWGPVMAPSLIASLMIISGILLVRSDEPNASAPLRPAAWLAGAAGVVLALLVFMRDALLALPQGTAAAARVLPTRFEWLPFLVALALMASPALERTLGLVNAAHPRPRPRHGAQPGQLEDPHES